MYLALLEQACHLLGCDVPWITRAASAASRGLPRAGDQSFAPWPAASRGQLTPWLPAVAHWVPVEGSDGVFATIPPVGGEELPFRRPGRQASGGLPGRQEIGNKALKKGGRDGWFANYPGAYS